MSFLQTAFYVTAIVGSAYFLMRRRAFDFFTVGFASGLVYFLPGFFGFVRSSRDFSVSEPLQSETYLVFITVLLFILAGAFVFDQIRLRRPTAGAKPVPWTITTEVAIAVAAVGLIATLVTSGDALFSPLKAEVMESTGRWHVLFRFSTIYILVFATLRKQMSLAIVGILFLIFDLYVGFRFGFVIAVLAAATLFMHAKGAQSLFKVERRSLILGVLLVGIVFVYKQVYTLIKLGLWDLIADRVTDPNILALALMTSEPFGTQSILNEVIRTDFTTGPSHLASVASLLVPFSNMLGAEIQSYNDLFQERLFGGVVKGGMANNIWAQMYSVGGWFGIITGVTIYTALLGLGSWLLKVKRGSVLALIAFLFTLIAFYVHRNDVAFTLTLMRRAFMIWVMIVLPGMLFVDIRRSRRLSAAAKVR